MAANMLALPTKRTEAMPLARTLRSVISDKLYQHPNQFERDLETLQEMRERLRADAGLSGLQHYKRYFSSLAVIANKLPAELESEFTWTRTFSPSSQSHFSSIVFEQACLLYNIAAIGSSVALASDRSSDSGIKEACNAFQTAASALWLLRTRYLPAARFPLPEDLEPGLIEGLELIMLAQAQECFWQKAVRGGSRDLLIAKLAVRVSEIYAAAEKTLAPTSAVPNAWMHHVTTKRYHFEGAAWFRLSVDCLQAADYGKEIAYLRKATAAVATGQRSARNIDGPVARDLEALEQIVSKNLHRAERDNDMIYLRPVMNGADCHLAQGFAAVQVQTNLDVSRPAEYLKSINVPIPLQNLLPYTVHIAVALYTSRREHLSSSITSDLQEAVERAVGCKARLATVSAGPELVNKAMAKVFEGANEVKRGGGIRSLETFRHDITGLRDDCARELSQARDMLIGDHEQKLKQTNEQYSRVLEQAAESDAIVSQKLTEWSRQIEMLSLPDEILGRSLPRITTESTDAAVDGHIAKLQQAIDDADRLIVVLNDRLQHDAPEASFAEKGYQLVKELAPGESLETAHFEDYIHKRLQRYDDLHTRADTLSSHLRELCRESLVMLDSRDRDGNQKMEELVQLEEAARKFSEIKANFTEGRDFYTKFSKSIANHLQACLSATHVSQSNPDTRSPRSKSPRKVQHAGVFDEAKHQIKFG